MPNKKPCIFPRRILTRSRFSPSPPPRGGEGRGEEVPIFPVQIPSPQLSSRFGGERESEAASSCALYFRQSVSGLSKCSPDGKSANFSKCSGRSGSEMACSALNHLPRSTSLQRSEQNGPNFPANQSPDFLQVGHLTARPILFGFGSNRLEITNHLGNIVRRRAAIR